MEVHWACKSLVSLTRKWLYTLSVDMQVWKHWLCVLHPHLHILFTDWGCRKKWTIGLTGEASSIRNNPGSLEKLHKLQMWLPPTLSAFQFEPFVWFGTCWDAQPAPGHPGEPQLVVVQPCAISVAALLGALLPAWHMIFGIQHIYDRTLDWGENADLIFSSLFYTSKKAWQQTQQRLGRDSPRLHGRSHWLDALYREKFSSEATLPKAGYWAW